MERKGAVLILLCAIGRVQSHALCINSRQPDLKRGIRLGEPWEEGGNEELRMEEEAGEEGLMCSGWNTQPKIFNKHTGYRVPCVAFVIKLD